MPIRQVLACHTARELTEWQVYEQAYGPIDHSWMSEVLCQIHEQMQNMAYLAGAKCEGENPMPKPRPYPRPGFMLEAEDDESDEPVEQELPGDEYFGKDKG